MKTKNFILVICITCNFALLTLNSSAQAPDWAWAKSAGGSSDDVATAVTADAYGNIYVAGYFLSDSITFGATTLINTQPYDLFIVKYDASGNVLWAKSAEGDSWDWANSVTADASGNIYLTGFFASTFIIFGSDTLFNTVPGFEDMFLVKYDAAGNVLWAKSAGGSNPNFALQSDVATAVTTDTSGNVYVAGWFNSSSLPFGTDTLTNAAGYDMFIVKYNAGGNVIWAENAGGNSDDRAFSVTADPAGSGDTYVTGRFFSDTITIGSDTLFNAGGGGADMFLVKYDANGNALWAKSAGGSNGDFATAVTADASGNSYAVGFFESPSIIFGSDTLINVGQDMFIVKYDTGGNVLWAKREGGVGGFVATWAYSVTADGSGNILVAGVFASVSITFGSITLNNTDATGNYTDIFIVKYDAIGNPLWAQSAGWIAGDITNSVTVDASGNSYVAGYFSLGSTAFGSDTLTNAGAYDMFIAKLGTVTSVSEIGHEMPNSFLLSQNYPNPFNPTTNIEYDLPKATFISLKIFNILGQEVATLMNGFEQAGHHQRLFNAFALPSGIYFYRLNASDFIQTKKLVLLR